MGLALITGPAREPVSLTEVLAHCRISSVDEDGLIAGYMLAARHYVEGYTRRALITQQCRLTIDDGWPDVVTLPRSPLVSFDQGHYGDTAGVQQALASSSYMVSTSGMEGRLVPAFGSRWPSVRAQIDAISVDFTCGYGDQPGAVPAPIRHAVLLLIGHWYENREAVVIGSTVGELPLAVEALLFPFRVFY